MIKALFQHINSTSFETQLALAFVNFENAVHGMEAKRKILTAWQDEFRGYKVLLHTAGEMI